VTGRRKRLARARKAAGLTQEELAYRVGVDRSTVGRWEAGETEPQPWLRAKLARHLNITPAHLDGLLDGEPAPDGGDAFDRLVRVIEQPRSVDDAVVDHLAGVLAQQRQTEDVIGPRRVLVPVLAELDLVERLAREARGPVRARLVRLAGEYRQFAGWMGEDTDDHPAALLHYARAMDAAQEVGDDNMQTSVLSMKSHLAWSEQDAARAIGLAAAGRRDPGRVSPGVLALITQQEARGHALDGDGDGVDRLLDLTEDLTATAAERPEDEPPWVYFAADPARVLFQRGVAYVELGRHSDAVDLFEQAHARLASGYRRDRGRYAANLAVAAALDGQVDRAVAAGREALTVAVETGSAHTLTDLRRMRRALDRWPDHPAVREFDDALAAAGAR
jgi:transcriptional regulator with XRE-family HTH domain